MEIKPPITPPCFVAGEATHLTDTRESDEEGSDDSAGFSPSLKPSTYSQKLCFCTFSALASSL